MTYLNPQLVPAQDTVENDLIPDQDKVENQDPDVLFTTDEVTGVVTRTERRRPKPDLTEAEQEAARTPEPEPEEEPEEEPEKSGWEPMPATTSDAQLITPEPTKPKSGPGSRGPYKKKKTEAPRATS